MCLSVTCHLYYFYVLLRVCKSVHFHVKYMQILFISKLSAKGCSLFPCTIIYLHLCFSWILLTNEWFRRITISAIFPSYEILLVASLKKSLKKVPISARCRRKRWRKNQSTMHQLANMKKLPSLKNREGVYLPLWGKMIHYNFVWRTEC